MASVTSDARSKTLIVGDAGTAARVTLNRPERRNALSLELMDELVDVLQGLGTRSDVRAIVVDGAGVVFSAGHDLGEMVGRDLPFYQRLFDSCTRLMETIHRVPQPVIAKVHGVATAAGCQLVAACDLAVAADDARFATPGVKIGLFCSTPMVPLSRAVGRKRALEMLLTGEPISAATALEWGLVNRVVPAGELAKRQDEVRDVISGISGFQSYYMVQTDDGGAVSMSVFDDQAGAEESTRRAAEWVRENLPDLGVSPPEVSSGEVVIHF